MIWLFIFIFINIVPKINARSHPIEIRGNHFYDSVTNKPFFIKGVDYQPGGSSGVNEFADPLSNPSVCVRDIYLFQELGINTIRVYSVNPLLNHDKCMTLLAAAGIYLVLDVNSPLPNQHLNRYEPWTTYNEIYLDHVFKVVNEFSGYNNTLAFFAGNEIINDQVSATNSPIYVKALIRDMKHFIKSNSDRSIPVGYSAADDLSYRISLAKYLECYESDPLEAVDFYGVNTYQWCGEQTFQSSGYNNLVTDYSQYSKPIFFSEYGCNEVLPRIFKEIGSIYSDQMTDVFSGGLVYEFAQEPNNYGLVDYDEFGNVKLLPDFFSFKEQISKVKDVKLSKKLLLQNQQRFEGKINRKKNNQRKLCELQYSNLDISKGIPRSIGDSIVKTFQANDKGKFVLLSKSDMTSKFKIFSTDGSIISEEPSVLPVPEPTADSNYLVSGEYQYYLPNENDDKIENESNVNLELKKTDTLDKTKGEDRKIINNNKENKVQESIITDNKKITKKKKDKENKSKKMKNYKTKVKKKNINFKKETKVKSRKNNVKTKHPENSKEKINMDYQRSKQEIKKEKDFENSHSLKKNSLYIQI